MNMNEFFAAHSNPPVAVFRVTRDITCTSYKTHEQFTTPYDDERSGCVLLCGKRVTYSAIGQFPEGHVSVTVVDAVKTGKNAGVLRRQSRWYKVPVDALEFVGYEQVQ